MPELNFDRWLPAWAPLDPPASRPAGRPDADVTTPTFADHLQEADSPWAASAPLPAAPSADPNDENSPPASERSGENASTPAASNGATPAPPAASPDDAADDGGSPPPASAAESDADDDPDDPSEAAGDVTAAAATPPAAALSAAMPEKETNQRIAPPDGVPPDPSATDAPSLTEAGAAAAGPPSVVSEATPDAEVDGMAAMETPFDVPDDGQAEEGELKESTPQQRSGSAGTPPADLPRAVARPHAPPQPSAVGIPESLETQPGTNPPPANPKAASSGRRRPSDAQESPGNVPPAVALGEALDRAMTAVNASDAAGADGPAPGVNAPTTAAPQPDHPADGAAPGSSSVGGAAGSPATSAWDLLGRSSTRLGQAGDSLRPLTEAERGRLLDRVTRAVASAGPRGGVVRLRLSPPELGALRLEVVLRDGVMHARVEAETPQARQLLLDGLPSLRERLAAQDITIERFDVDLSGQSPGGFAQQPADDQGPQGGANPFGNRPSPDQPQEPVAAPHWAAWPDDQHLNVVI